MTLGLEIQRKTVQKEPRGRKRREGREERETEVRSLRERVGVISSTTSEGDESKLFLLLAPKRSCPARGEKIA